jgi:RimJ/RimL family protein N-acetyltransferase
MIIGPNIRLRAIEPDDLPMLAAWRNDPAVYAHFFEHEPLSLAGQRRWYDRFVQRDDEKFWIAERTGTGGASQGVGTIALVGIDWRNRRAELGRVLVYPPGQRGNRVHCEVFADNRPAVSLYENLGFRAEGTLRSHVFKDGRYRDVAVMSILRDEWASTITGVVSNAA